MVSNYTDNRQYFKTNYFKALEFLVPKYILTDDETTFDKQVDIKDQIINSHIDLAFNTNSVLKINAVPNTYYSSISAVEGISQFFIKQNELTEITPNLFQLKILDRFEKTYKDFSDKYAFKNYLTTYLLPNIHLNSPTTTFRKDDLTLNQAHIYLIENLSWLYFLNTSGQYFSPSTTIAELISDTIYFGKTIELNDCIKVLSEHLWRNNLSSYIPRVFLSSTGQYTSGTQQLDKLKTWIDIVYSPLYSDKGDLSVYESFDLAVKSDVRIKNKTLNGPFYKLLRTLSLAAYDSDDTIEKLRSLNNIEECPDEFLPDLAKLIGWKLFGSDAERWRLQLRNAFEVYKRVGTKKSIEFALNSIFPKNIFAISSKISELWESYIPYLIYYSIATESTYFKSDIEGVYTGSTEEGKWNSTLAEQTEVGNYSYSSLDENMRLITDRIIYEMYSSSSFSGIFQTLEFARSGGQPYLMSDPPKFFYRNREYPIPPFEEYPYYVDIEINQEMVDFIVDRLVCFGVPRSFADKVGEYITTNCLEKDEFAKSNSWLFFTSGFNPPPNFSSIVANLNGSKFEYVSLWSGKSSHFRLALAADDFDFNKKDFELDSGEGVQIASQMANEFCPAHSIPLVDLSLSANDVFNFSSCQEPLIPLDKIDYLQGQNSISNYGVSGLNIGSYKRNIGGDELTRINQNTLHITENSVLNNLPRNSIRRRNYEKLMPMNGYYDRTGFNMPVSFDPSVTLSGIPLGFIPSSLTYQSISSYSRIPDVYSICNNVNSPSSYYGYSVSNTLRCRGYYNIECKDYYTDRGQLPEIYATIHDIAEKQKYYLASATIPVPTGSRNKGKYLRQFKWKKVYESYANSATENYNWTPSSVNNYYNFKFGKNLHKLYQIYTKEFNRHNLAEHLHYADGCNIFSHTYGPILYNHDFDLVKNYSLINTSTSSNKLINTASVLNPLLLQYGTFIEASSYLPPFRSDIVNSGIVDGVELVMPSGSPNSNYFSILKVPSSSRKDWDSLYMFDKTFLKIKSNQPPYLPRIRFDISKYTQQNNSIYPVAKNFLLPENEYKINVNSLVSNDNGLNLGGRTLAVWIHTKEEGQNMWSYMPDGTWVRHNNRFNVDSGHYSEITNKYFHKYYFPVVDKTAQQDQNVRSLKCIQIISRKDIDPLLSFDETDFTNFEIKFNTYNTKCFGSYIYETPVDNNYFKDFGQVHRKNQNYVIEVMLLPANTGEFLLLDKVEVVNLTMNEMSKFVAIGNDCSNYKIDLSKNHLNSIFKFWNDISGKNSKIGLASRDSLQTSGTMYSQGGSRLDYRLHTDWLRRGDATGAKYFGEGSQNLFIENIELLI